MAVKDVKYSGNKPVKSHKDDAGFDLVANSAGVIPPKCHRLIPTGTHIYLPNDVVAMVCPRSGLANKYGVTVLNAPGIVDAGYTGDVGVILYNSGNESFYFSEGDRIAQLVLVELPKVRLTKTNKAPKTDRADEGFGSTGV